VNAATLPEQKVKPDFTKKWSNEKLLDAQSF
jgi:hypothetical protein